MDTRPSGSVRHQRLGDEDKIQADGNISFCGYILITLSMFLFIVMFPFSLMWSLKVIQQYERGVLFRLGRVISKSRAPGLCFLIPCVDSLSKVDLRLFTYNIAPQEILTKDSVTVMVDAVIYARIYDATMATINVMNAKGSTLLLGATTLRTTMGTVNLADILSDRERIAAHMQEHLDGATHAWGVKVERVEIKDVKLPIQMQRAMAAEAEATREARAKVIAAEGEMKASRSLKGASDVMSESPAALQLRYLQTLQTVSEEQNHTVVLPYPADLLKFFGGQSGPLPPVARRKDDLTERMQVSGPQTERNPQAETSLLLDVDTQF